MDNVCRCVEWNRQTKRYSISIHGILSVAATTTRTPANVVFVIVSFNFELFLPVHTYKHIRRYICMCVVCIFPRLNKAYFKDGTITPKSFASLKITCKPNPFFFTLKHILEVSHLSLDGWYRLDIHCEASEAVVWTWRTYIIHTYACILCKYL